MTTGEIKMNRAAVKSSMMNSAGYDAASSILEVEFNNGTVFQYSDVPASLWAEFENAESQGRLFGSKIRNQYTAKKVSEGKK